MPVLPGLGRQENQEFKANLSSPVLCVIGTTTRPKLSPLKLLVCFLLFLHVAVEMPSGAVGKASLITLHWFPITEAIQLETAFLILGLTSSSSL